MKSSPGILVNNLEVIEATRGCLLRATSFQPSINLPQVSSSQTTEDSPAASKLLKRSADVMNSSLNNLSSVKGENSNGVNNPTEEQNPEKKSRAGSKREITIAEGNVRELAASCTRKDATNLGLSREKVEELSHKALIGKLQKGELSWEAAEYQRSMTSSPHQPLAAPFNCSARG